MTPAHQRRVGAILVALTATALWLVGAMMLQIHPAAFLVIEGCLLGLVLFGHQAHEDQIRQEEEMERTPVYDTTMQAMGLRDLGFTTEFDDWKLDEEYPPTVGELLGALKREEGDVHHVAQSVTGGGDDGGAPPDGDEVR